MQSDWTPWSMCSVTCGGGEHLRTRKILRHPKYGGKSCDGALAELKECARHACGGPAPIDCKYSSWNHWGDCDKCNGERSRVRNIDNFPSNGGEECDPKATMEIGKCPRRCGGQKFCEWTVWGTWSDCTVTCGKGGKRRRRRHLELTEQARNELPDYVSNVAKKFETLRAHAQELQSHQMSEMACAPGRGGTTSPEWRSWPIDPLRRRSRQPLYGGLRPAFCSSTPSLAFCKRRLRHTWRRVCVDLAVHVACGRSGFAVFACAIHVRHPGYPWFEQSFPCIDHG